MNIDKIISESIDKIVKESSDRHKPGYFKDKPDRHRDGYWKERWAKQKAEMENEAPNNTKPAKKTKPRKDRHKPGYYREYNKKHPERLNRGFTKGYNNGNVSDGAISTGGIGKEVFPGIRIVGYDEIGRPITNSPLYDALHNKEMEWHDDDWDEGSWDD